jgi:hypothetical protein
MGIGMGTGTADWDVGVDVGEPSWLRTPGTNCSRSGSAPIATSRDSRAIRFRNIE